MTSDSPSPSDPGHGRRAPTHGVVVNHEEQYSIWPLAEPLPAGWAREGVMGTAEECLAHIGRVWTDMRPLSIRGG
ncbi:MAG TPA: MbtH family NRPS accessory protein [Acidimicrobiales bacterium]|nr:MbtH family NRPS accessory protein [Acidimicrobiales bacterium]